MWPSSGEQIPAIPVWVRGGVYSVQVSSQITTHTHSHTFMLGFGLWKETGPRGGNQHVHGERMQTPNRKVPHLVKSIFKLIDELNSISESYRKEVPGLSHILLA